MADDDYQTQLLPEDETAFQTWKSQNAPLDSGADYDLRGAYKMGMTPAANGHWPDTFKKPNHPTFSDQSMYSRFAPEKAGRWEGETYIPPAGVSGMADDPKTPTPSDDQMGKAKGYISGMRTLGSGTMSGRGDLDDAEAKTKAGSDAMRPGAPQDESPGGPKGGLGEFLFQFLKSNPDIAREMSTRMNAVINGQKLQGLKGAAPGGAPAGPPGQTPQSMGAPPPQPGQPPGQQMAGDVIPLAGERSMGPPVYQPADAAAPFAAGLQSAPNIQSIGKPTLQEWLSNYRSRQG